MLYVAVSKDFDSVSNAILQDNANSSSSRMDIYVQNIQKGKHGSDTGAYDAQGRSVMRVCALSQIVGHCNLQRVMY